MGRKKSDRPRVEVRLRIDPELQGRIARAAEDDGTTVAGFLRALAVRELRRREKRGD